MKHPWCGLLVATEPFLCRLTSTVLVPPRDLAHASFVRRAPRTSSSHLASHTDADTTGLDAWLQGVKSKRTHTPQLRDGGPATLSATKRTPNPT